MQSSSLHVAIIMDGNGRWATSRGLPRQAGHAAGARHLRSIIEAAPGIGVGALTLYAFSSDNWRRPKPEVDALMALLEDYLRRETPDCVKQGLRLRFLGRRDRLSWSLRGAMQKAESETAHGRKMLLQIAVDYSSRDAILEAAASLGRVPTRAEVDARSAGDVDLLIRTGGEQRLSDFLLWECAYAELLFLPVMWPDFTAAHLADAVGQFGGRERRFGQVAAPAAG